MVDFLIRRPIAVLMAFTAAVILGWVTYQTLPVSLLPDIAIPQITVQVSQDDASARQLESTMVRPLRQQLIQVSSLKEISSQTRDGAATISLTFDYGTRTDLAFIEVNEKIDAAMTQLPKDADRPQVVKASATDIPVFYLHLTLREDAAYGGSAETSPAFLELCQLADNVIRRRIEQLPQVAMVDATGIVDRRVQVVPDQARMAMLGLSIEDLEQALSDNNVEPGSMTVRDGHYEYHIKLSSILRTADDVSAILLRCADRLLRLGDLAEVSVVPTQASGMSVSGGKRAVTLAVVKQADENMASMMQAVGQVVDDLRKVYPDIEIAISRNQTDLLNYTISGLQQNLVIGLVLILVVAVFFLGDVQSPAVIGISLVVSIVVCFLFFYLAGRSLNIISLSGLILAVGMMIDSSIIVTENIAQYRERGYSLRRACVAGTTEVITPMLSSMLTTVAVFLPMIFMSGIAGALFFDQAFAVTAGLLVSYFVGIMLLPVLYLLVYRMAIVRKRSRHAAHVSRLMFLASRLKLPSSFKSPHLLDRLYDRGIYYVFAHKRAFGLVSLLAIPLCVFFFFFLKKERMPQLDQTELMVQIEWNENIHLDENRSRVEALQASLRPATLEQTAAIGQQDYLLQGAQTLSSTEAELYLRTAKPSAIAPLQAQVHQWMEQHYPQAVMTFAPPPTVFEQLFTTGEADVVAQFYARNTAQAPTAEQLTTLQTHLHEATGYEPTGIAFDQQLDISIRYDRLLLYRVAYTEVERELRAALRDNAVATLHSFQQYLPIHIVGNERTLSDILSQTLVRTEPDDQDKVDHVPLSALVSVTPVQDLKTITAGRAGEYIPYRFYDVDHADRLVEQVRRVAEDDGQWDVSFAGAYFTSQQMMQEMVVVLLVSVLLMYFILAAQFESFLQPLIVLVEIPIDVGFALVVIWLTGHTLNLMSAIGLVVTCGIIINDSILKLDAINTLRRGGTPLMEAIHTAGRRRLRPIVMTSLTTIFAMAPLLFAHDMGSELQQPLAVAMIAAMVVGTLVSLFIIPLAYAAIYRQK